MIRSFKAQNSKNTKPENAHEKAEGTTKRDPKLLRNHDETSENLTPKPSKQDKSGSLLAWHGIEMPFPRDLRTHIGFFKGI